LKRAFIAAIGLGVTMLWAMPAHAALQRYGRPGPIRLGTVGAWRAAHSSRTGGTPKVQNLTYHGGPVQTSTTIYIDFWRSDWNTNYSMKVGSLTYTYQSVENYVESFFTGVGQTQWIKTDSQYCSGAPLGSTSCASGDTYIDNSATKFGGFVVHSTTVPSRPTDSSIETEAKWAQNNFKDTSPNALYMVFSPHAKSESGFGTQWCAWHSGVTGLQYAYIPFMPDAGTSCGRNFVNKTNNAFGNGYFDGYSMVAGHEFEETQSDPQLNAWYDASGNEDADKCAWNSLSTNISDNGTTFAVQPLWSNAISGCSVTGT